MNDEAAAPLLSVIIPVYNRAGSIADAIASVAGACRRPYEIIVVDDGSSDGSADRARAAIEAAGFDAVARVVTQRNAGPGPARNTGAGLARGRYLAFLDSDDFWFPWTLDTCARAVLEHPDAALVFIQNRDFRPPERPGGPQPGEPVIARHARFLDAVLSTRTMNFGSCNVLVRRDAFFALGGFTDRIRCTEDTDLFMRADPLGPCILIKDTMMMAYRLGSADGLTSDTRCVIAGFDYQIAMERAGRYPGGRSGDPARVRLLANAAVHTAKVAFAAGYPKDAYRILFRDFALIYRGGQRRWLLRLLGTPVLAAVRPESYRFRRKPG